MALLWPRRDESHARKLLNQSVYVLRRALGDSVILSAGDELRFAHETIECDVVAFEEALSAGDALRAMDLYAGPFLDGFHLDDALEFERWVDTARMRLAGLRAEGLEQLAEAATTRGDAVSAVEWWLARAVHDPYDSRIALRLMESHVAAGNPAGALRHAETHERVLRSELQIELPDRMRQFVERLRVGSSPTPDMHHPTAPTASDVGARPRARDPDPASTVRHSSATIVSSSALAGTLDTNDTARKLPIRGRIHISYALVALVLVSAILTVRPDSGARGDGSTSVRGPEQGTHSIAALEFYERGVHPDRLRSADGARQGLDDLRRAVAIDSTFAAAWAALACLALRVSGDVESGSPRQELLNLAGQAALRAVALDDERPEGHAALGLVRMATFDFTAAERHLRRAVAADPTYVRAQEWLVTTLLWTGRPDEALEVAEGARQSGSLSASTTAEVARALTANDRCDEALNRIEELGRLDPPLLRTGSIAATCHARQGKWRDAITALRAGSNVSVYDRALLGYALARAGEAEASLGIRTRLANHSIEVGALPVAIVDAGRGELDKAFDGFHRAVDDGSLIGSPLHFQIMSMLLDRLGQDPRMERLRARIRLEAL